MEHSMSLDFHLRGELGEWLVQNRALAREGLVDATLLREVEQALGRDDTASFRALWEKVQAPQPAVPPADPIPPDTIISLGNRVYRIGSDRPRVLTEREDALLQAFLDHPAMDEKQLGAFSGFGEDAVKELRKLLVAYDRVYAPAIDMPGGKAKRGYHIRIRRS
jgi:hypothetical protein